MYLWALVGRDPHAAPILAGTSGDLAKAMRETEPMLKDGRAFLAVIEEVRLCIDIAGQNENYVSTGRAWGGRRTNSGGVHWEARSRSADSAVIYRVPGGLDQAILTGMSA